MHNRFAAISHESLKLVVEFTRNEHADNPYSFEEIEPQEYHVRDGEGLLTVARFPLAMAKNREGRTLCGVYLLAGYA